MHISFNRAMVALDLSSMDKELIRYVSESYSRLGIEEVYFVHIMPDFAAPGKEDPRFKKLFNPEEPLDEMVRKRIKTQIEEILDNQDDFKWTIEVIEGKPYQKLMHWLEVKKIDLLLLGKKPTSEGSGITAKRVARHADCHVLLTAPRARGHWRTLLVPIDFSSYSEKSMAFALEARKADPDLIVNGLYVIEMPMEDYYYSSNSYSGYRPVLRESAEEAYRVFVEKHKFPKENIEMEFLENEYGNISGHISSYAKEHTPDLIVIGAQGHSAIDRFLFGSVTEKLVEKIQSLSMLLIR